MDVIGKDRGIPLRVAFAPSAKNRHSMTATHVNAKKPVLKLRLGPRSSEPQDPDPAPVSAPKPAPAINPGRAAHLAELEEVVEAARAAKAAEIAKTVEAHTVGKAEVKRRATALLGVLCDRYPKAFDIEHPRPLKVGIDRDIAAEMDDTSLAFETDLRNAMRLYSSSLVRIDPERAKAIEWRSRNRTRDALPKKIAETLETGAALIKAAKGLGG